MARPKRRSPSQKVTLRIDPGVARKLAVVAAHMGQTRSKIIEDLILSRFSGWSVHTRGGTGDLGSGPVQLDP